MRKPLSYGLLFLPVLLAGGGLFIDSFSFIVWLDWLFAVGLILLMAGGGLSVANGGFFRAFNRSWKSFFSAVSKREHIVREAEGRKGRSAARFQHRTFSPALLIQAGLAYCLFSLALSFMLIY